MLLSVQFEVKGDLDTLDGLDKNKIRAVVRKHPWLKDEKILLFTIQKLKEMDKSLDLDKFIIAGHSNGADVAKYFANNNQDDVSHVISFDGRRCPIAENAKLKILIFEASKTSTDIGMISDHGSKEHTKRFNMESGFQAKRCLT